MRMTRRALLSSARVMSLAACRIGGQAGVTTVTVEPGEYDIKVDKAEVPAGKVGFAAKNVGQMEHELIVLRTDLPADRLPYNEAEQKAEKEQAGKVLGEIEQDFPPAKRAEMTLDLTAGHYVLLCNMPTHYKQGMHLDFRAR